MDNCIAGCHALKQELQYIIRVLPVDINKFETYGKRIDEQITDLRAYRTALISDVVTGKIDVRNN